MCSRGQNEKLHINMISTLMSALTVEETALQADSWDCSKETEDIDDIKHRRFFDAVQNEVYVKRLLTLIHAK